MYKIIVPIHPPDQVEIFKNGKQFKVEKLDEITWVAKDLIVGGNDKLIVNHIYKSITVATETNYRL